MLGFHQGPVITGSGLVTNFGQITGVGANVSGVIPDAGGFVSNASTGTITGGIFAKGATATAVNSGTALGNTYGGASYYGKVNGGTASSILELASGASTGTLSGLGTNFHDFGFVLFDSGSHRLATANTAASGMAFNGFSSNDTIDITGFTAPSSSTLAGGLGIVLTNASSGHATLKVGAAASAHVGAIAAGRRNRKESNTDFKMD